MTKGRKIRNVIASFVLFIAFMLPTTVQFFDAFEAHEYSACCDETNTHLHEEVADCHICDFNLPTFNNDSFEYPEFSNPDVPVKKVEGHYTSLFLNSFKKSDKQLRAPPYFLVS